MSIEDNENKVGYGSWYCNQTYNNYRDKMTLREYQLYLYEECKSRIESLSIKKGDHISFIYIGGHKPRRFSGEVEYVSSHISIRQKSRIVSFDISLIDEIEFIQITAKIKVNKKNKINEGFCKESYIKRLKEKIDLALDNGDKDSFVKLSNELKKLH